MLKTKKQLSFDGLFTRLAEIYGRLVPENLFHCVIVYMI